MPIFDGLAYLGLLLSVGALFGIGYHKKRIAELTIAVGTLCEKVEELEKIIGARSEKR